MPNSRPATLTTKQLASAVGSAVKMAADKHKVTFENDLVIGPGTICGPKLRLAAGLTVETVNAIAEEITAHVNAAHAAAAPAATASGASLPRQTLTPGFTVLNKILICGFWPGPIPIIDFGPPIR